MSGMLITDRVKQLVRLRGPLIPSQISKEIGTNILMASAILSELASKNDVKISSVKVGGTPLYYVPGQESKLQNYLTSLHQKEKEAFEQLKLEGVLRDSELEPAIRVALRQIKDFAKPLEANISGEVYLFWKWYLLTNDEAEVQIKKIMGLEEAEQQQPKQEMQEQLQQAAVIEPVAHSEIVTETPVPMHAQASLSRQMPLPIQYAATQQAETVNPAPQAAVAQLQPSKPLQKKPIIVPTTEFTESITDFLGKSDIEIESTASASRAVLEYVVLLPSPVGKLRYYCIAKNKKTCTDTDISSALIKGQLNKLPVLLLTKGALSKKAQELLSKEIGSIVVKKI